MVKATKTDTRGRLLAAANQLFLEHSIDDVSISEIHATAGQKNTSAINYHFGGKNGLVLALVEPRLDEINRYRQQRIAQLENSGSTAMRDYVAALIMPQAEQLFDSPGGVVFIRLMAQLIAHPAYDELRSRLMQLDDENNPLSRILTSARGSTAGDQIWMSRWVLVMSLLYHGLADYSRLLERPPKKATLPEPRIFFEEIVSAITALIENPAVPAQLT